MCYSTNKFMGIQSQLVSYYVVSYVGEPMKLLVDVPVWDAALMLTVLQAGVREEVFVITSRSSTLLTYSHISSPPPMLILPEPSYLSPPRTALVKLQTQESIQVTPPLSPNASNVQPYNLVIGFFWKFYIPQCQLHYITFECPQSCQR